MGRWRSWTTGEIRRLVALRESGVTLGACAAALGRTEMSVAHQLCRRRIVRQARMPAAELRRLVGFHARRGRTDQWIALKLKRSTSTVSKCRQGLGLAAHRDPVSPRRRPRCLACDVICPIARCAGWKELTGWVARQIPGVSGLREIYCRKCFAEYGWPEFGATRHNGRMM